MRAAAYFTFQYFTGDSLGSGRVGELEGGGGEWPGGGVGGGVYGASSSIWRGAQHFDML